MFSKKISEKTATEPKVDEKQGIDDAQISTQDYLRVGVLASLSLYLRIMKLGFPPFITDIELETTRQVNWYMSGKFFIGKFPPLVGIVSTGLARLVGYYGSEDLLYAGQPFVEFPVVALRRFSALLGALLVPLCYMTLRNMGHYRSTATLAAALLIFENGIVTQSRFASPEIYALFFGALATFSWTTMRKHLTESHGNLTTQSGYWQTMTGISMGCALSSKWTGVLAFPVIWTSIIIETWHKLCEKQNNVKFVLKQVLIYFLSVGLLPLSVYLTIFQFHFNLVPNTGDHDLLVSSKLKYSLQGNQVEPSQPNIAFGSRIVLKHVGTVGGYLHSHPKRFTGGSTQQEVTLYPYVDLNNLWTVHKNVVMWNNTQPIEFVRNGDQIRFEHFASNRKLHSHDHRPQLTGKQEHSEVTAYGDRLILDSHDYWNLQILNDDGTPSDDKTLTWKPLTQKFRLQHIRGCMLISHNAWYLPPLGEGHQEVTCMASAGEHLVAWQVESTYHEQLEGMKMISFEKISIIEKLAEVHNAMYKYPAVVHNRLQMHSAEDGSVGPKQYTEETPTKWFFKKSSEKIWSELAGFSAHLILNPMLQKLIAASLIFYIIVYGISAFLVQRQIKVPLWFNTIMNTRSIITFYSATLIQLQLVSFLPSHTVSMSDILNAMYYGTGLFCVMLESCTTRFHPLLRRVLFYSILFGCISQFSQFSRLAYGGEKWFRAQCEESGLDIDCIRFPPAPTELVDIIENSGSTQNSTLLTIYVELAGGTTQPFRYNQGQEEEADRHIAMLKHNSFIHEATQAKGIVRYHRAVPTPALTVEDAIKWAQEVDEQAMMRQAENDQKLAESRARAQQLKEQQVIG